MKQLMHQWGRRSLVILAVSILLCLTLSKMSGFEITVVKNSLITSPDLAITTEQKEWFLYVVPWLKEAVFIGLPMLLLIIIRNKKSEK